MQSDQDARDVAALTAFEAEFEACQRRLREFLAIARRLAAAGYPGAGHLVEPVVDQHLVDRLGELRELLGGFQDPAWTRALDAVASVPEVQDRMRERGHAAFRVHVDVLPEAARVELDAFLSGSDSAAAIPQPVIDLYVTLTGCSPHVVERALTGPNAGAPEWWFHLTS